MKKEVLVIFCLVLTINFFVTGQTKPDGGEVSKNDELRDFHDYNKKERFIVKFDEEIGAVRGVISLGIELNSITNFYKESVALELSNDELEKLKKTHYVEKIEKVRVRDLFLLDSIKQVNASLSHQLVSGVNLTGAGQTVCIIDSGVNYSHPDLGGCFGNNEISSGCKVVGGRDYCANDVNCASQDEDPMDVNGHGTHIAGIVAANGAIKGVAPDTRIIAIKACNSTGACFDNAIKSGIQWCINNKEEFNISVISMSLGGGLYSDYCNDDPLAADINQATGAGIAVIVSSGNSGSTSQIAAPACVENASAIGSIQKNDLTFNYNRNSLVKLVAPGVLINSTALSGGYNFMSGTSVSAPHASAAFAIINQYLNSTGQRKSPKEIEQVLNLSGKRIYDSGSDRYYSRIDLYKALISLDIEAPEVRLIGPENGTKTSLKNITFSCNSTDLALKNGSLFVWGESSFDEIFNFSGSFGKIEFNISEMPEGLYHWNCLFSDENNNYKFASANYSLFISDLDVFLVSPQNGTFTNSNISFRCDSVSSSELSNITFQFWKEQNLEYYETFNISGRNNSSEFYYNFSEEAEFEWNCIVSDINGSKSAKTNNSIIYDVTNPDVSLSYPEDGSSFFPGEIFFDFYANDSRGIKNCKLLIGEIEAVSKNQINNGNNNFSYFLSEGTYYWRVVCEDFAGNLNISEPRNLVVLRMLNNGGGTGKGGGFLIGQTENKNQTILIDEKELRSGKTVSLKEGDRVNIVIKIEENKFTHEIILNKIENKKINLTIKSDPLNLVIFEKEEIKLSLNSDRYYDLVLKVESIQNNSAKIKLMQIWELKDVVTRQIHQDENIGGEKNNFEKKEKNLKKYFLIWTLFFVFFIVVLILVAYLIWSGKKKLLAVKTKLRKGNVVRR